MPGPEFGGAAEAAGTPIDRAEVGEAGMLALVERVRTFVAEAASALEDSDRKPGSQQLTRQGQPGDSGTDDAHVGGQEALVGVAAQVCEHRSEAAPAQ